MAAFRLLLYQHTPAIIPFVPLRLDGLLHEACCRLHRDWHTAHELPLVFDEAFRGYRGSQLFFGTTVDQPMAAAQLTLTSSPDSLERHRVSNPPKRIDEGGGGFLKRLSQYRAHQAPYMIFYGDGDPDACVALLRLLDGIGREHNRSAGAFSIGGVTTQPDEDAAMSADDFEHAWRWRSAPVDVDTALLPYQPMRATQRLVPTGTDTDVFSPPRILREVTA